MPGSDSDDEIIFKKSGASVQNSPNIIPGQQTPEEMKQAFEDKIRALEIELAESKHNIEGLECNMQKINGQYADAQRLLKDQSGHKRFLQAELEKAQGKIIEQSDTQAQLQKKIQSMNQAANKTLPTHDARNQHGQQFSGSDQMNTPQQNAGGGQHDFLNIISSSKSEPGMLIYTDPFD